MPKKTHRTPPIISRLQSALLRARRQLDEYTMLSARLKKLGIRNTNLHLRGPNKNKMIAYDPTCNGERVYHYIGTDPAAQQKARDDVARYVLYSELQQIIYTQTEWLEDVEDELAELLDRIDDRLQQFNAPAPPTALLNPSNAAHLVKPRRRQRGHRRA